MTGRVFFSESPPRIWIVALSYLGMAAPWSRAWRVAEPTEPLDYSREDASLIASALAIPSGLQQPVMVLPFVVGAVQAVELLAFGLVEAVPYVL